MRFSIRTIMATLLLIALAITGWKYYIEVPPLGHGSWSNSATLLADDHTTQLARIDFGIFEANNNVFAGYLIRTDGANKASHTPWLEFNDGALYIEQRRILPQQRFQMFVSENGSPPRLVLLETEEALKLKKLPARWEKYDKFWSTIN